MLKFSDYESKLKFMNTALFLFGMKLHRQVDSIEFYDADFATTLSIKCDYFDGKTISECCTIINEAFTRSGYTGDLMTVGKLKGIEDFKLGDVHVRNDLTLVLRFNSFEEALEAERAL
jgi:hypothetical protein